MAPRAKIRRNALCPCGSGKKFKLCHGQNRPYPKFENVSSIRIDEKNKQIIFVTKDVLINQISRDGPAIAKSFDQLTAGDIQKISEVVADTMSLIFTHTLRDTEDYKSTCARLLSSAMSTLMASVEVARHGFRRPYGAISRGIVETLATILHIAIEPEALTNFHAGKLQSTKSVSIATRAFPPFGRLYGMFSNQFVHINKSHAGFEPIIKFQRGEEPLSFILSTLRVNAWLMYVVSELVFHDEIPNPRYWKNMGGGAFAYNPSSEEQAWQRKFLADVDETALDYNSDNADNI